MAYKPPLSMRLFHYALWGTMLFVVIWFIVLPLSFRATTPNPTAQVTVPSPASVPANTP
ncbi:hypothetical protein [Devosia submarina]|uniref:hypothetical protein n=1 Tax=Devosia submarina TaxID=1173082 RepID=UPI001300B975|nr:hypothetical protein [Devosia submarina]